MSSTITTTPATELPPVDVVLPGTTTTGDPLLLELRVTDEP
jgi:hypothetical protein